MAGFAEPKKGYQVRTRQKGYQVRSLRVRSDSNLNPKSFTPYHPFLTLECEHLTKSELKWVEWESWARKRVPLFEPKMPFSCLDGATMKNTYSEVCCTGLSFFNLVMKAFGEVSAQRGGL